MQGGVTKKKEDKKKDVPLRNVLGSYDPMTISLGLDQPINLSTMLTAVPPVIKKDTGKKVKLPSDSVIATLPPKKTDEKVVKYLESKGKIKPKEEAPPPEDPSWFERNKKGLRDAGIILAGGLQSLGEGIKGGNQTAANEQIYQNLDATAKADEMELLEDPNSEQSKQARSLFTQQYGNRVKMPENMSAAQFSKLSPVFDKILQRRLAESKARESTIPKLGEASEKNVRLAKRLQDDYTELANLQKKVGNETFGTPESQRMDIIKDRIIEAESVLSGQGALEQGIREKKLKSLDVGTFEDREEAAKRNTQQGQNYYFKEAKNIADQTGMDLDQDEKTGKLYLVDPRTGQRVRAL